MTNLEKLLNGIEVEWKPLGEICDVVRGKRLTKRDLVDNAKYPVFHGGLEPIGYYNKNNRLANSAMIINVGASAGTVGFCKCDFWSSDGCFCFSHASILNQRYLFYALQSIEPIIKSKVRKAGIPTLDNKYIERLNIPIPCADNQKKSLEIQLAIVETLDKFTELEAELEAELDCRKRQYNYYRNKLLNSDVLDATKMTNDVKFKTLGKIAEYSHERINAKKMTNTNYVGVDNLLQNRAGKTKSNYVPSDGNLTAYTFGDVLIGNIRPYLKKIWFADNNGGTNGDVLVIHLTDKAIDNKYLYHVLSDDRFFIYNMKYAKGAKMPRGNKQKIMDYLIPIPYPNDRDKSIIEQQRIVSILDKFDKLTTSISEGLPAEIELRRKQYEYYRNKLLSFPNAKITQ